MNSQRSPHHKSSVGIGVLVEMLPVRVTDLADHHVDDIETRYEFLEEIGQGASSQVYLARRRSTPSSPGGAHSPVIDFAREVAIKVFDTEELDDDDVFEAVKTEVEVLRRVRHPYIVRLVEVICDASSFAVVSEALTGGDMHARLTEEGALTEDGASEVFARVVLAVEHLHSVGIAHRDLKAENLVALSMDAEFENAYKLVDLGSAFQQPPSSVGTSPMRMTGLATSASYCAPEVARSAGYGDVEGTGAAYGAEADLWSLGVLLFVMLSRRLPFALDPTSVDDEDEEGDDEDEGMEAQILERVAAGSFIFAPVAAWRSVSADAKDLIRRLLTIEPTRRLSWEGVRRHPWCAQPIATCEATLAMERGALATPPIALPETPTTTRTPLSREGSSEGSVLRRRSSLGKEQAEAAMAAAAAASAAPPTPTERLSSTAGTPAALLFAPAHEPATSMSAVAVVVGGCTMAKDWSEHASYRRASAAATAAGRLHAILERRRVHAVERHYAVENAVENAVSYGDSYDS